MVDDEQAWQLNIFEKKYHQIEVQASWRPFLTSSFAPFGRSGHETHADNLKLTQLRKKVFFYLVLDSGLHLPTPTI